ncbi:hypothetical protein Zm00014a_023844 [Zea mays]|uniref:Uncharacterized protein n=1 Tax=Zea mays TaxID=4577 RepID=A0A317YCZ9_MAIZE|nr:hypothetical protein Zm00014a_023844 [Zea mays]
MVTQNTVLYCS